ncbi:MAG: damage-inducible protein DinB [Akkermansiaceae bacterium]|nr:damage-inducible protein DinB [Armatimonadota bacterium]
MNQAATPEYCRLMARYNAWVNTSLYAVCASLSEEERRRAFAVHFQSVHGTLNHLLYGDLAWLGRFMGEPYAIISLTQELYGDFEELRQERKETDSAIMDWADSITEERLGETLTYRSNVDGVTRTLAVGILAAHFFNHQTHHRGQLTTLLALLGKEPPITDIPWMPGQFLTAL